MTTPTGPVPARRASPVPARPGRDRKVRCPVCREFIDWDDNPTRVHEWVSRDGRYNPVDLSTLSEPKRGLKRSECYVLCPAKGSGDPLEQHYLPADYHRNGPPLVIGLVGRPSAGKTHLLVAMLAELFRGAAAGYGLTPVTPLDHRVHAAVEQTMIRPFTAGERLAGTSSGALLYAEAIQVTTPSGPRTIVFYDIAGDEFRRLNSDSSDTEFLLTVSAVLFVEDVDDIMSTGNEYINGALGVLKQDPNYAELPTAIVLAKADQERYTEPLDHWLREPPLERPWDPRFHEESRDVYAWLHRNEATYLLGVVKTFRRCTLHVASATGGAATGDRFPRGVRPTRVLEPLVALLAAIGVLPDDSAAVDR